MMEGSFSGLRRFRATLTGIARVPNLGQRWEALAWDVPQTDGFPEGLKYSFQYLGPADEEILRYDNANDAHGVGRHHRHHHGEVEGLEFEGLRSHIQKFLDEVETIHEQEFA
jgi:hypothetical protein